MCSSQVRRAEGIYFAPFEQGEVGTDLFRAACGMGLDYRASVSAIEMVVLQ